jgi:hypothetical protein
MSSTTPVWVPVLVAAFGVAGTAATAWFTQRASKRREDERWAREREADEIRWARAKVEELRERRVALYVDIAEYVQRRESTIEAVTDAEGIVSGRDHLDVAHPDRLSARVKLLAPADVARSWAAFVEAEEALMWVGVEDPDGYDRNGHPYLNPDNKVVADVTRTATEVHASLRNAMKDPDFAD